MKAETKATLDYLDSLSDEYVRSEVERICLERIAERSLPTPPEGFTISYDRMDLHDFELDSQTINEWDGPAYKGNGWTVKTYWHPEHGVSFYIDPDNDTAIDQGETINIAEVLAQVATLGR